MNSVLKKIIEARKDFGEIKKDVKGYDYKYADLEGIMRAVSPALEKAGVTIFWNFDLVDRGGQNWLECTCIASDGESSTDIQIYLPLTVLEKCRNPAQEMGKLYTYARRYSIASLLNLVSEQDTDAASAPEPARASAPMNPEGKPFVDSPAGWTWLEMQMQKFGLSDKQKSEIKSQAIGKLTNELEYMIQIAARG